MTADADSNIVFSVKMLSATDLMHPFAYVYTLFPLIGFLVVMHFFYRSVEKSGETPAPKLFFGSKRRAQIFIFIICGGLFAGEWVGAYFELRQLQRAYVTRDYSVVSGRYEGFHGEPSNAIIVAGTTFDGPKQLEYRRLGGFLNDAISIGDEIEVWVTDGEYLQVALK